MSEEAKAIVAAVIERIVDAAMDNHGCIDERSSEYLEMSEAELRTILNYTVNAVELAIHEQVGIEGE